LKGIKPLQNAYLSMRRQQKAGHKKPAYSSPETVGFYYTFFSLTGFIKV